MSEVTLRLNGHEQRASVPEGGTLAELLREQVGLTGTKIACEEGTCGACTVLLDGRATLSCILLAVQAEGSEVTTIEGLGDEGALSVLQRAFVEEDALQCGFCTAGQVVSATALLAATPQPTSEQVRMGMSGNLCRCGAYQGITQAVLEAQKALDAASRKEVA
jgi:aerobic carbon-monoxide dehydrogenase small subunit